MNRQADGCWRRDPTDRRHGRSGLHLLPVGADTRIVDARGRVGSLRHRHGGAGRTDGGGIPRVEASGRSLNFSTAASHARGASLLQAMIATERGRAPRMAVSSAARSSRARPATA
jgi:hypothetical protein